MKTMPSIQPAASFTGVRFAGAREVKQNLVRAAVAAADYEGTQDRFNLGQAHAYAAAALSDPAFSDVLGDPKKLATEEVSVPKQGKDTLVGTLRSQGIIATFQDALVQNLFAATGNNAREINVKVPVQDQRSLRDALSRPGDAWGAFLKVLTDNAFRSKDPLPEVNQAIVDLGDALEDALHPLGLDDLPMNNWKNPTSQWEEGE